MHKGQFSSKSKLLTSYPGHTVLCLGMLLARVTHETRKLCGEAEFLGGVCIQRPFDFSLRGKDGEIPGERLIKEVVER